MKAVSELELEIMAMADATKTSAMIAAITELALARREKKD